MNTEETKSKGIFHGGIGLLLCGIAALIYAIGQLVLGSMMACRMEGSTWMRVEDQGSVSETSPNDVSIEEVLDFLVEMSEDESPHKGDLRSESPNHAADPGPSDPVR